MIMSVYIIYDYKWCYKVHEALHYVYVYLRFSTKPTHITELPVVLCIEDRESPKLL